jgi:hypothetical protein
MRNIMFLIDLIKKFDPSCRCYCESNIGTDTFTLFLFNCQSDRNRDILEIIGHKAPDSPSLDTKNFSIIVSYEAPRIQIRSAIR